MPSPFPGMDPYLEGYLWPDVHGALAAKIRQMLTPMLRPRYTARLGIYMMEDSTPEADVGILYPDVEMLLSSPAAEARPGPAPGGAPGPSGAVPAPAPLTVPVLQPFEVRLFNVQIHDAASNRLVTSLEILSPVNKREPGLGAYRQKRQRLYQAGVHLLELDLLRRGARVAPHPRIPEAPYRIQLTRAHAPVMEVWPLQLQEALPVLPVPLLPPDEDVTLDLQAALAAVYDEAAYDLSIDYGQPPPPPLSEAELEWARRLLQMR